MNQGSEKTIKADSAISITDKLLWSAKDVSVMIGVSERTLYNLHSSGILGPLPVRLKKRTFWFPKEIIDWVAARCPKREVWLEMQKGGH